MQQSYGGNRTTDVQFAAAAMAGVSYDFSSFFAIDVNYRFLHIGGSGVSLAPDDGLDSRNRRPQRAPDPRWLPVLRELGWRELDRLRGGPAPPLCFVCCRLT